MSQPLKIGLACAGGVVEGAFYEIGALCALEEAIAGLHLNALDVYVGVSSGSLIASCLANGISPRTLSRAVISKADPVLNIRPEVLFKPAYEELGRRLMRLPQRSLEALGQYLRHPADQSLFGAASELASLLPVGVFDNAPLERYLAQAFATAGRTNDFRRLNTTLRVVAIQIDTSEVVCFGDAATAHVPISKAVQASTALPGFYSTVEIDGQHYIDGVARRTVHASVALNEEVGLLFCVNPIVPVNLREAGAGPESLADKGLPFVLSQTFRTLVYSRMQTGFKAYDHLYPEADILLIEPPLGDQQIFFSNIFSFSNRRAVCEHAYATTRQYLRDHASAVGETLARHGLALRQDVLDDAGRTLYGDLDTAATTHQARQALDRLDQLLHRLGKS
jgi:predicted acylesterase/phospholipase RssA